MKRTLALLLLLVASGCDQGTRPVAVEALDIVQDGLTLREETLRVGGTLQLGVQMRAGDGTALSGRPIAWRSTLPAVASVDSAGRVAGHAPGTTLIIATVEQAADTVRLSVMEPSSGEFGCAPETPVLSLALGEVHTTTADRAMLLCLDGGAAGAEYTLIPFHASTASGASLELEIAAAGVVAAAGPPSPALAPGDAGIAPAPARSAAADPQPDHRFHRALREWERTEGARLATLPASGGARLNLQGGARGELAVGQMLELNVNSQKACTDPIWRAARVEAVTRHAIVVADTSNPAGGFSAAEYRQFGETFDTLVWNVVTHNFGEPTDVDGNERVIVFFTRAVNEMTPAGQSNSYVGGFYYGRDLSPRTGTGACAGSNMAEIFYQLVPDPQGTVNGNARARDFVAQRTVGVLAHEFQHLINHGRRRVMNRWPSEEVWMNEGLSHIAEELVFYEASHLRPRSNLDRPTALTEPVRSHYIGYQNSNIGRLMSYLRAPHATSPVASNDSLGTRGAAWSFLRYAADRKAAAQQQPIWYALVNSSSNGIGNLNRVIEASPLDWMHDWSVATYTDDAGFAVDARYLQPSWNFRSIMPAYMDNNNRYPLRTVALKDGAESGERFTLAGGGSAYLRFGVGPGQRAAIRTTSGGIPAPVRLRLSIVRTR